MISKEEKKKISEISKKYDVKKVLLFGSSLSTDTEASDIDLAVDGIASSHFFEFCGELLLELSKPVDVVDISRKSRFTEFILRQGVVIYG